MVESVLMFSNILRLAGRALVRLIVLSLLALLLARLVTWMYALPRTYSLESLPERGERTSQAAIVFGAGLRWDGSPSPVLRDRINAAAELYFAGTVDRLLMSGDNRYIDYNEPGAMRAYALNLGVPDEAIVLDYAGRRTYDTCYRAATIFGVRRAVLVTQQFHLPRALYTCNKLGVQSFGVPANRRSYLTRSLLIWNVRESLATAVALWEVHISHPLPVLGEPQPIFPLEAQ